MVTFSAINLPLVFMTFSAVGVFFGVLTSFLLFAPLNIVGARVSVAMAKVVRRYVFDREQRYHEIVPSHFQEIVQ